MPIEAKKNNQIDLSEVNGKEFRIPSISRFAEDYRIENLNLFYDWRESPELKDINVQAYCKFFNEIDTNFKGQVLYDSATNLIIELSLEFPKQQSSRIYLETGLFGSIESTYRGENITNLRTAILYQAFISRYLTYANDNKNEYAYIERVCRDYYPQNLSIPKNIDSSIAESVSQKRYREYYFPMKASYICGQFSSRFQYLDFGDDGFLHSANIDMDACSYNLSDFMGGKTYTSHNVDNAYQAATLHGIVASYINDLIERKESQSY